MSTSAGIPDYRDEHGEWKRERPVEFRPFMTSPSVRQRYWLRSTVGWPFMARLQPSVAHRALARLEALGFVQLLITQNVDVLHEAAAATGKPIAAVNLGRTRAEHLFALKIAQPCDEVLSAVSDELKEGRQ